MGAAPLNERLTIVFNNNDNRYVVYYDYPARNGDNNNLRLQVSGDCDDDGRMPRPANEVISAMVAGAEGLQVDLMSEVKVVFDDAWGRANLIRQRLDG